MPVPAVLEACREYAQKYVDLQTSQFERIGCLGRWDDPYRTMSRDYEARTLEAFYGFLEKGFVYRGLSRFTGVSTIRRRWPKLKLSTQTTPALRSTCDTGLLQIRRRSIRHWQAAMFRQSSGPLRHGRCLLR